MCRWFDPRRIIQGADTLRRLPQSNQIGALRFKASIAKKPQRGGSAGANLGLCRWASTRLNNSQARTSFQENPAEAHLASGPRKKRPQPRGGPGQDRSVAICAGAAQHTKDQRTWQKLFRKSVGS